MKRPIFLTIWLALMSIGGVYTLYSYTLGSETVTKMFPNILSSGMLNLYVLLSVVNLFSIVMLWMWKKIGFYIIIGTAIIAASLNGMLIGALGVGSSIFAIVGVGILYFAMKPVWQNFK